MRIFLSRKGINLSKTTVHKYMNRELQLFSLLKRRTPGYIKGNIHKVFPDLLNQNFKAENVNQKWCTDFTYLFLKDGQKRYNCSIIDLYDRSVIASLNSKTMTAELAINTLKRLFPHSLSQRVVWFYTVIKALNTHQKPLLSFVNLLMLLKAWAKPDAHMTTLRWKGTLTLSRMS